MKYYLNEGIKYILSEQFVLNEDAGTIVSELDSLDRILYNYVRSNKESKDTSTDTENIKKISQELSALKQINIGTLKQLDSTFTQLKADKLGLKIFIPSLTIAIVAMIIAQFTPFSGTVAIGIAATVALLLTFAITKAKPIEYIEDSNRMFQSVGVFAILPQLLASLGALFTAAGVGDIISNIISGVIPDGNRLAGVIAYCVGMAIFTAIMGNGFAAFSVITVGIGVPFVFAQGGDPIVCSALALTAGFCGTLLTPMAANFNMLPAALLEMKDKNGVIKAQAPFALVLLTIHIILMYTLGF